MGAARSNNEDLRESGFEIKLKVNDDSPRPKKQRGNKLRQPGGFSRAFLNAVNKSMQVPTTSASKVYTRFDAPKPNGKLSDM